MLFRFEQFDKFNKAAFFIIATLITLLAITALPKYTGHPVIYILFTLISNTLLYFGFRKNANFFDMFIGVFFWVGFWLKFTLRIAFSGGTFSMAPYFNNSAIAYDRGLLVASCGLFALILASFVREKFFYNYPNKISDLKQKGLFELYMRNRKTAWILFVALFIFIGVSNMYFGIYIRGTLARTILPFGLNGVYTWLLMFGLTTISALMIRFEFELNNRSSVTPVAIGLVESAFSNVSLLSRGMVLSAGAFLYGIFISLKKSSIKINIKTLIITLFLFASLFISSVLVVNYLRVFIFSSSNTNIQIEQSINNVKGMTTPLFVDRWVGIEEVLAVSSYPKLSWNLWFKAWKEKTTSQDDKTQFYNSVFSKTPQIKIDRSRHLFINTLPGILAFFFYPGSYLFLFCSIFSLGIFAASLEFAAYKLCGQNLIICACLAQAIAFRFSNFGYVPAQSYLLFGTILLNILIIYCAEKLSSAYYKK